MALGGSTNAAVHIIAMARRAGVELSLDDLDAVARRVPVLANLFPSGDRLMEDFHYAGGLPALMNRLRDHLSLDETTVTGRSCANNSTAARWSTPRSSARWTGRSARSGALAVLRGNLAPDGAVIKPSAANPRFFRHRGRALVFDSQPRCWRAMADPAISTCDENTVLVLRNAGPVGAPGMPEWGNLPIPKKLLQQGVRDMVRLSDARMSGTHYGSCVLHISPESAVGGPLALVQTGDRSSSTCRAPAAPARRPTPNWRAAARLAAAGAALPARLHALYQQHVTQAHEGCDFDFLQGTAPTPEPSIY
jgi:dihydroxyacid dehydratase/phosphogluconate dehydratase